jgi:hypothetical protein
LVLAGFAFAILSAGLYGIAAGAKRLGIGAGGYHWVNILLHAANALLLWGLLRRLRLPAAWLAAALFALHPVQVESVAWVTELKNVLSLFFCLLTAWAWVEFVEDRPGAWRFYAARCFCRRWRLLAKTTACTWPVALLLILWLQGKPIGGGAWQIVPFFAMGLIMGLVSVWWERHHQYAVGDAFALGWMSRVLIASRAVWFYLGKLLWPAGLSFSYARWHIDPADPWPYSGWPLVWQRRGDLGRGPRLENSGALLCGHARAAAGLHQRIHVSLHLRGRSLPICGRASVLWRWRRLAGQVLSLFGMRVKAIPARALLCSFWAF